MEGLLPFFLILFASVVFGTIFEKIHLPWVVALMVAGVVLGPHGFDVVQVTPTLSFLGELGLVFVMFMAGLETKLGTFAEMEHEVLPLAFLNGFIPFLCGLLLGLVFGYGFSVALLIGIIFISSSIAIVIPSLEANGVLETKLGQAIMATSILQDVASLILLSMFLQSESTVARLPLWLFYPLLVFILIGLKFALPLIEEWLAGNSSQSRFQSELRVVFMVLLGTVVLFELLGLHSIIGGFFAGFVLADSVTSQKLKQKLKAMAYGVFVPTFFVVVGMEANLGVFTEASQGLVMAVVILLVSVGAKLFSGFFGALTVGFNKHQSVLFGVSSVPQLSTTLAATFSAMSLGLIDSALFTSFIILSVVTTLVGPTLMGISLSEVLREKDLHQV